MIQLNASKISKEQQVKILKTSLYLGVSAAISAIISAVANDSGLFGPLTPIVNIVLVTLKQLFTQPE